MHEVAFFIFIALKFLVFKHARRRKQHRLGFAVSGEFSVQAARG